MYFVLRSFVCRFIPPFTLPFPSRLSHSFRPLSPSSLLFLSYLISYFLLFPPLLLFPLFLSCPTHLSFCLSLFLSHLYLSLHCTPSLPPYISIYFSLSPSPPLPLPLSPSPLSPSPPLPSPPLPLSPSLPLSLSPSLPLSLSPSLPLSLSPSLPLSLSPSLPLSLSPSLPISLSPSLPVSSLSLPVSLFLLHALSPPLSVSFSLLYLSLSLPRSLSIYLSIYLHIYLSIYLSLHHPSCVCACMVSSHHDYICNFSTFLMREDISGNHLRYFDLHSPSESNNSRHSAAHNREEILFYRCVYKRSR